MYAGPVKLTKLRLGKRDRNTGFAVIENIMQTTPPSVILCHPGRSEKIHRCLAHNKVNVIKDINLFSMLALRTNHVLFTPKAKA